MANDLGRSWQDVRDRLFKRLGEGSNWNIQSRVENISYLTPDGKQERQQIVLSQGRGAVFCQIYPYGDDLYIGWDAYLNYGQWVERAFARGYDFGTCGADRRKHSEPSCCPRHRIRPDRRQ